MALSLALLSLAVAGALLWTFFKTGALSLRGRTWPARGSDPVAVDLARVPGVDGEFLRRTTERLAALGFRTLLDFELPHCNRPGYRELTRAMASEDGRVVATITAKLSDVFAHDLVGFATFYESGRRLHTSNTLFPVADIDPFVRRVCEPGSLNVERMLRRHRRALDRDGRRGEKPRRIDRAEELSRELVDSWNAEVNRLAELGLQSIEGDRTRPTRAMVWRLFWAQMKPVRSGYDLVRQWLAILGPAVAAAAVLACVPEAPRVLPWLAMAGVGAVYGWFLWTHAFVWCALVPPVVASACGSGPLAGAGWASAAFVGMVAGFFASAGRGAGRRLPFRTAA
jgi:hypothetical protein